MSGASSPSLGRVQSSCRTEDRSSQIPSTGQDRWSRDPWTGGEDRWSPQPSTTLSPEAGSPSAEFAVAETNTPLAPPYSHRIAEKRKALVLLRSPTASRQVYHVYTSYQEDAGFPPVVQLRRTYLQPELAVLDAHSWTMQRNKEHGGALCYHEDTAYCDASDGKCRKFSSPRLWDQYWKVSYCAWTVEVQLF